MSESPFPYQGQTPADRQTWGGGRMTCGTQNVPSDSKPTDLSRIQRNFPPYQVSRQPFRCPVCNGSGLVPTHLYGGNIADPWGVLGLVHCRSCSNTGIVWG